MMNVIQERAIERLFRALIFKFEQYKQSYNHTQVSMKLSAEERTLALNRGLPYFPSIDRLSADPFDTEALKILKEKENAETTNAEILLNEMLQL